MTKQDERLVLFRLDATSKIGSGHAMRCLSIAEALKAEGVPTAFVVSCSESQQFLEDRGAIAYVVGGDPFLLGKPDARLLIGLCERLHATAVLIDTYGARDEFYDELAANASRGLVIAVMDDMYSIEHGPESKPRVRPCDIVVNYDFLAKERGYDDVYGCKDVNEKDAPQLLLGPSYAPVRKSFRSGKERSFGAVRRILVTSGSTNPDLTLEKMVEACSPMRSNEVLEIDVIVGALAKYSPQDTEDATVDIRVHRGICDLSPFMHKADIMISAGGSTLYEAACAGIPAIAIPIVENQIQNVKSFARLGLGIALGDGANWAVVDLRNTVEKLAENGDLRAELSESSQKAVDGNGASRIAVALGCL